MKRKLLFSIILLYTYFSTNAQQIELIGKGIYGKTTENLPLTNSSSITSVRVGAIYSWDLNASEDGVNFEDVSGTIIPDLKTDIIHKGTTSVNVHGAYYTAVFENPDDNGININVFEDQEFNMQSFYAYIYRNDPNAHYNSFANLETVYFWKNTADYNDADDRFGPYIYEIDINTASGPRDIKVKIPISELEADKRVAIINITAGSVKHRAEVTTYMVDQGLGNSFFIGEYILSDVPGNIDKVQVSIYSPTSEEAKSLGYKNPDSFYVSGVIVDVDNTVEGCTLTQGYWKNHSDCKANGPERDDTWDKIPGGEAEETIFFLSRQDYCEVFDTQSNKKNGKYYILAHQYIAAQLNMLAGADPTAAQAAFDEATILLENNTPEMVKGNANLEADCVRLGGILDEYNNGVIGPGHCDDSPASILGVNEVNKTIDYSIYPNPTNSKGSLEFVANQNSKTTVSIYSITGIKVAVLFDKETLKGQPIKINFNSGEFVPGIYFINIKNGRNSVSKKIIITN